MIRTIMSKIFKNEMNEESNPVYFQVYYDGDGLKNHEMDVRDLASSLLAIADVLDETNKIINNDNAEIQVKIKGSFKGGSFPIDFSIIQNIFQKTMNLFQTQEIVNAATIITIVGFTCKDGLIHTLKWLKSRKIKEIRKENDKADKNGKKTVTIITEDGDSRNVDERIILLMENNHIRKSLEKAITEPLKRGGVDVFAITNIDKNEMPVVIKKNEKEYFVSSENNLPESKEILNESISEKLLYIVSPSFQEGYKWRFSSGDSTFFADIHDEIFLQNVENQKISFTKNDMLKVKMREKQSLSNGRLKTDYIVENVVEHIKYH